MKRLEQIIVDAIAYGVDTYNKNHFINDINVLNNLNSKVDLDFGTNLCNLNDKEQLLWYFVYNFICGLNNNIDVQDIINTSYVYIMTI